MWFDVESREIVSEKQLFDEYNAFRKEQPEEYNYSFKEYIANCESKNGTLIPIYKTTK